MSKSKKYYVVWQGNTPGVYDSWTECQLQIKGYPGAQYKAFKSKEAAEEAFYGSYDSYISKKASVNPAFEDYHDKIVKDSVAVDAACSGNPGDMEYRGVLTSDNTEIFRQGPFKQGTNNVGEFLAIVHALALFQKSDQKTTTIYTDSRTAMAWVRNKKVKTNLKQTRHNAILFELMQRAEKWLRNNTFENPIVKWETKVWGEIPADFGRK